jgi:hypothetical protein
MEIMAAPQAELGAMVARDGCLDSVGTLTSSSDTVALPARQPARPFPDVTRLTPTWEEEVGRLGIVAPPPPTSRLSSRTLA